MVVLDSAISNRYDSTVQEHQDAALVADADFNDSLISDAGNDSGISIDAELDAGSEDLCGNSLIDNLEECDGTDLGGATCLSTAGYPQGTLSCDLDCTVDTTYCYYCGNGMVESQELCDGTNMSPNAQTCAALGLLGQMSCNHDCMQTDASTCYLCGNGTCEANLGETIDTCYQDCAWVQLSANLVTLGLRIDGTVWIWPSGYFYHRPGRIAGIDDVVGISMGGKHTCALKVDGSVWCWGFNDNAAIGNGITSSCHNTGHPCSEVPIQVIGVADAVDIKCGYKHSCALTQSGDVLCWGANDDGQLGIGDSSGPTICFSGASCSYDPVQVAGLPIASVISAGGVFNGHSCAVAEASNNVYCWGNNDFGQLGTGAQVGPEICQSGSNCSTLPLQTSTIVGATGIDSGYLHSCAIASGGVLCWGYLLSSYNYEPTTIPGLTSASRITSGSYHACAEDTSGAVLCWGSGLHGQLGNVLFAPNYQPTQILNLSTGQSTSAGNWHTCSIDSAGEAWCWGDNTYGQLGVGGLQNSAVPMKVVSP